MNIFIHMRFILIFYALFIYNKIPDNYFNLYLNFSDENISSLKAYLSLVLLKLMFEKKHYSSTPVFDDYYSYLYKEKNLTCFFLQTNKYVENIILNKAKFDINDENTATQKSFLKNLYDFRYHVLNDETLSSIQKLLNLYPIESMTSKLKNDFCKEMFYIFVQEFSYFLDQDEIFYRNLIYFFNNYVSDAYLNIKDQTTPSIRYERNKIKLDANNTSTRNFYFHLNAFEYFFSGYIFLVERYRNKCIGENIDNEKCILKTIYYYDLNRVYVSAKENNKNITFFKSAEIYKYRQKIKKIVIYIDTCYINFYDDNIILDSIELWCRKFCATNKKQIELLKYHFLKMCKLEFTKIKNSIVNDIIPKNREFETKKQTLYIYKTSN